MSQSFNNFSKLAAALPAITAQIVRQTALDGQANVKAQIQANDQIETGFMLNSVYTVTSEGSTYQGGERALPEVDKPATDQEAYFAVAAEYSVFPNYGTRFQPAKPFWEPGVEKTQQSFDLAMQSIERKLKELSGA